MFAIIGQILMSNSEIVVPIIGGMIGALTTDILEDNTLVLPKVINGKFCLGFIGGVIIGATAGYTVDGSFLTAFTAGFSGKTILESLAFKKQNANTIKTTE
jgi:hypothetical protein